MASKKNANNAAKANKTPNVVVDGAEDKTVASVATETKSVADGTVVAPAATGEDSSKEQEPVITKSVEPVVETIIPETDEEVKEKDYTVDGIVVMLGMANSALALRLAQRLSNFCTIVDTATELEVFNSASNSLADVINILNRSDRTDFVEAIKGITNLISTDLETFGAKSCFHGLRPFRPFLGACPPQCRFLETMLQLNDRKTRKVTIKRYDPASFSKFLNKDKKELFRAIFSE